ncbi:hypothetical protein ICN35_00100 [Polynucleobacter sp. es-GGE-1]|uniref:hypothetical protein n=1 Tax=Polynucleobacter sp. es-GGE-1 TaxID=1819724 RepID=UPI001C0D25EE|nr:hypothetical protein [Polynucleobacter sp. es-GGE-1]MBU3633864.1 hypothetical protein [Polynucleobacter sp. es-GGE-1]
MISYLWERNFKNLNLIFNLCFAFLLVSVANAQSPLQPGYKVFSYPAYPALGFKPNNCQERINPNFKQFGIQCLCDTYGGDAEHEGYADPPYPQKSNEAGVSRRCLDPSKWVEKKRQEEIAKQEKEAKAAKEQQAKQNELNREKTARIEHLKRVCKGRPKATVQALEGLSRDLQVNPRTIEIVRTEIVGSYVMGSACFVTLYTPKGSIDYLAWEFDSNGTITMFFPANGFM